MEKKFNISESELVKVVNTLVEQRLKEAMTGSNNASPASDGTVKMVTSTLDADGLFPTGSSEPNPKNSQFQQFFEPVQQQQKRGLNETQIRAKRVYSYDTLPANAVRTLGPPSRNPLARVIPPTRGGFVWPGNSNLKFAVKYQKKTAE